MTDPHRDRRLGLLQGILAYGLWGIVAAYWKLLGTIDPVELIAHRVLWGLVVFCLIVVIAGKWRELLAIARRPRAVATMAFSGTILAINWTLFVGATTSGHMLDASLGYFINPLVSVALGMLVLGERLRRLAWIAIGLATTGVAILTWRAGVVPWISLVLAVTFGLYGLVRKTAKVDALVGSALETLLLAPIALGYLLWFGDGAFTHANAGTAALLAGTGAVTAIPLVLFTSAARRLPLSTVGFLQYLAPTGQFLLATLVYGEQLAHDRLIAFAFIWVGLVAFSIDLVRARGK